MLNNKVIVYCYDRLKGSNVTVYPTMYLDRISRNFGDSSEYFTQAHNMKGDVFRVAGNEGQVCAEGDLSKDGYLTVWYRAPNSEEAVYQIKNTLIDILTEAKKMHEQEINFIENELDFVNGITLKK